jgi:hypothetical protein
MRQAPLFILLMVSDKLHLDREAGSMKQMEKAVGKLAKPYPPK